MREDDTVGLLSFMDNFLSTLNVLNVSCVLLSSKSAQCIGLLDLEKPGTVLSRCCTTLGRDMFILTLSNQWCQTDVSISAVKGKTPAALTLKMNLGSYIDTRIKGEVMRAEKQGYIFSVLWVTSSGIC